MVGLCIFGGTDTDTDLVIPQSESAFENAFSEEKCLAAWAKIGAAPITRKCLSNLKVRRQLGDAADGKNSLMAALNEANFTAVAILKERGYD